VLHIEKTLSPPAQEGGAGGGSFYFKILLLFLIYTPGFCISVIRRPLRS
jgi:hypothetical protein